MRSAVAATTSASVGGVAIGMFMVLQTQANGGMAEYVGANGSMAMTVWAFLLVTVYSLSTSALIIAVASWRRREKVMKLIRTDEVSGWRKLFSGMPGALFLSVSAFVALFVTGPAAVGFGIVMGMVVPRFVVESCRTRTVSWIDLRGVGLILLGGGLVAAARGLAGVSLYDVGFWLGWLVVVAASAWVAWQFDTLGAMARAVRSVRASSLVSSVTGAMWAGLFLGVATIILLAMHESPISADFLLPINPVHYLGPVAALGIIPVGAYVAPILGPVVKPILTNVGIILMTVIWELMTVPHTLVSGTLLLVALLCAALAAVDRVFASKKRSAASVAVPEPVPAASLVLVCVNRRPLRKKLKERAPPLL